MWRRNLLKDKEITYDPHLFDRKECRNLDLNRIEETIRSGMLVKDKSEEPSKLCFRRYFGKGNLSYIVITRVHKKFIEVKTAWTKKGK